MTRRPQTRLSIKPMAVGIVVPAALLILVAIQAWYPFRPQWPIGTRTPPVRSSSGTIAFDGSSVLASRGAQTWVGSARRTGNVLIELELRATRSPQHGPARVLTVSRDFLHSDLTVGQDGADLIVRVRRPGSDLSGEPPLRAPGLLGDHRWHHVRVVVHRGRITVVADGRLVAATTVRPPALAMWDPDYRVALGDEPVGERGWVGELRQADVDVAGRRIDLLAESFLDPGRGLFLRSRARGLFDGTPNDPVHLSIVRLLAFVPLGAALQWRWRRWRSTLAALVSIAAVLLLGKLFVAGRDPVLADALLAFCGGLIGCLMVARNQARHPTT